MAYHMSEQFIQASKAVFSGDVETHKKIMGAKSAVRCKTLGKEVTNCDIDKWNAAAEDICYPGILSKFRQNPGIANFLKNTGTKTILECCYDNIYGEMDFPYQILIASTLKSTKIRELWGPSL